MAKKKEDAKKTSTKKTSTKKASTAKKGTTNKKKAEDPSKEIDDLHNHGDLTGVSFEDLGIGTSPQKEEPKAGGSEMLTIHDIPIGDIIPSPWNPNEQSNQTFNELVESIQDNGCDEPLLVVHHAEQEGKYTIIGGEHRHRAMSVLGFELVPCVIKEDWDELKQKIETVRRNILTGELNPQKFTALVNGLIQEHDIDLEAMSGLMGFEDFSQFAANYIREEESVTKADSLAVMVEEAEESLSHVDNLSLILNMLFTNYADTLPGSFMYFLYRRRMHSYVRLNDVGKKSVDAMMSYLKERGLEGSKTGEYQGEDINSFLAEAINNELKKRNEDVGELEEKSQKDIGEMEDASENF